MSAEAMVEALARELAKARTGGNVYMDGGHNPLPTEYVTAHQFLEPLLERIAELNRYTKECVDDVAFFQKRAASAEAELQKYQPAQGETKTQRNPDADYLDWCRSHGW